MANETKDVVVGCCCMLGCLFFGFWTFFSIVGAIHYSNWSPKFSLDDVHIRSFNVTPAGELNYDMDILMTARHFSSIRRIEQYSYEIYTSHIGPSMGSRRQSIGSSSIPGFNPKGKTMALTSTQKGLVPLGSPMGSLVTSDLASTGRVAIRVYIKAQIYTPLFLAMKKRGGWTCDLIVTPSAPPGSQIYDRLCCKRIRCLNYVSSGESSYCALWAPNCCLLPPSNLRQTISICG